VKKDKYLQFCGYACRIPPEGHPFYRMYSDGELTFRNEDIQDEIRAQGVKISKRKAKKMAAASGEVPKYKAYTLTWYDMFHFPDYDGVITDSCDTKEEALKLVEKAKKDVDDYLMAVINKEPNATADEVFGNWSCMWDEPIVRGPDFYFSGWDYAIKRSEELVKNKL